MKRETDPDVVLVQAVADSARLAILRQLTDGSAICACDFTGCCGVAQPTVSHHLRVLREAGWVRTERRGAFIYYSMDPRAAERFLAIAEEFARALGTLDVRRLPVVQTGALRGSGPN